MTAFEKVNLANTNKNSGQEILDHSQSLSFIRLVLAWGIYPFVIVTGMGFSFWMASKVPVEGIELFNLTLANQDISITQSHLYLFLIYFAPVLYSALCVYLMERFQTLYDFWRPEWKENIASDVGLFVLNNFILRAEIFVALGMAAVAGLASHLIGIGLWPTEWPLVFQVVLFLVLAEFMSYWLHRLEHEQYFLWRIHCVHHNPNKYYWFNGTRFHYIDIILLPLFSNIPAVILGAEMQVIYLATTFSVMHGFWQHCNARVHFGWLNYIVASPELHRWHHSKDMTLANNNYGSNLIIWDLVFGTWLLPNKEINPKQIGVKDMPADGVLKQILMPFTMK